MSQPIKLKLDVNSAISVTQEQGNEFISGYASNKGMMDTYGWVLGRPGQMDLYDIKIYKTNPILLIDHCNEGGAVAGGIVQIYEDEVGLFVKAKLAKEPKTEEVAHSIQMVREGFLKTFSISGWFTPDEKEKNLFVKVSIDEISLVAVPADNRAIGTYTKNKKANEN